MCVSKGVLVSVLEEALGQHLRAVARVYALCESGCSCCGVC